MQDDITRILDGNHQSGEIPELWDGQTSKRILKIIVENLK
jgi:hypothetical protein